MPNFVSFTEIEGFHNVVKTVQVYPHVAGTGKVPYRGKIKLHGTNAGVRVKNGEVEGQSRSQIISLKSDNSGFARWLEDKKDFFAKIKLDNFTIFGEWCGRGIMKGTALNKLDKKIFAVFAIVIGDSPVLVEGHEGDADYREFIHNPAVIEELLAGRPDDVHILPWFGETYEANFNDRDTLVKLVDDLNKVIEEVEPCDPWVKTVFGVEGTGEGVVYYPYANEKTITYKQFKDLAFKAKGEKHKVVKTKEAVQVDPEVAKSIEEFVTMFVTEPRLEQGVAALGGTFEIKNTGNFLKWLSTDVLKESVDELEASGLTWEQVNGAVQVAARSWYIAKSKAI
jgi:hypothetical protein